MPRMHLPVKVKFSNKGPHVYLKTGDRVNKLDEDSVAILDDIDILSVNLDIRPYDWEVNGKLDGQHIYSQSRSFRTSIGLQPDMTCQMRSKISRGLIVIG